MHVNCIRRSLSIEDTFTRDKPSLEQCFGEVEKLYPKLLNRLKNNNRKQNSPIKALYIKLCFDNSKTTTAQKISLDVTIQVYKELINKAWKRYQRPVRLIGLGIELSKTSDSGKLELPFSHRY